MSWGYQKAPMNMSNCSPAQVMLKVAQHALQVLLLLNVFLWLGNFYQRKLLSALPPGQHHKAEDPLLLFLQSTYYILVSRSSLCVYIYIYIKSESSPFHSANGKLTIAIISISCLIALVGRAPFLNSIQTKCAIWTLITYSPPKSLLLEGEKMTAEVIFPYDKFMCNIAPQHKPQLESSTPFSLEAACTNKFQGRWDRAVLPPRAWRRKQAVSTQTRRSVLGGKAFFSSGLMLEPWRSNTCS